MTPAAKEAGRLVAITNEARDILRIAANVIDWRDRLGQEVKIRCRDFVVLYGDELAALYTHPAAPVGVSEEMVERAYHFVIRTHPHYAPSTREEVRAILAEALQEPRNVD
jgi:hypothetical protein